MRTAFFSILMLFICQLATGQNVVELSASMFDKHQQIELAPLEGWTYSPIATEALLKGQTLKPFKPTQLSKSLEDESGRVEGWFQLQFKLDESFKDIALGISREQWAATDVYIDGQLIGAFGDTGNPYKAYNPTLKKSTPVKLSIGEEHTLTIHFVDYENTFTSRELRMKSEYLKRLIQLSGPDYNAFIEGKEKQTYAIGAGVITVSVVLFLMFLLLLALNPSQKLFALVTVLAAMEVFAACGTYLHYFYDFPYPLEKFRFIATNGIFLPAMNVVTLMILEQIILGRITRLNMWAIFLMPATSLAGHLYNISAPFGIVFAAFLVYVVWLVVKHRKKVQPSQWTVVVAMAVWVIGIMVAVSVHKYRHDIFLENIIHAIVIPSAPILMLIYISVRYYEIIREKEIESTKVQQMSEERKQLLEEQNTTLERQVKERTAELNASLENLKATQSQLIQSEKMASLGELTAGIAHEIQNPLNFVNNFSEVSKELLVEMKEELDKGNAADAKEIADSLISNLEKINHHGKRADGIVKGMLQHSRTSSGQKELTDINVLCDEYLRLSFHGLRAKDKTFNSKFETDFDQTISKINIISQDIGRVVLNLLTNAFHAVNERKLKNIEGYEPTVWISTKKEGDKVVITVRDNGSGIPEKIIDKIFQPFFTTKPTGQGTGLGLSLSYDIIKAHGGKIEVFSKPELGSEFRITLITG